MNYLGHFLLAYPNEDLIIGNFLGDFLTGHIQKHELPTTVAKGVAMHRFIDSFTDSHPTVKEIKKIFTPAFQRYDAVLSDIAMDYFIANHLSIFESTDQLADFTQKIYTALGKYDLHFTERQSKIFKAMKQENWLLQYQTHPGIQKSFRYIIHKAKYLNENANAETALELILTNFEQVHELTYVFYQDIRTEIERNYFDD